MFRKAAFTLIALALMLGAPMHVLAQDCDEGDSDYINTFPKDLTKLEHADAYADYIRDKAAGKLRFIGFQGVGLFFLGIDKQDPNKIDKLGVKHRVLCGTSDVIMSNKHGRLMSIAGFYAQTYNSLILFDYLKRSDLLAERLIGESVNCDEGQQAPKRAPTETLGIDIFEAKDPEKDAASAIKKGDFSFYIAKCKGNYIYNENSDKLEKYGYRVVDYDRSKLPKDSFKYKSNRFKAILYIAEYNELVQKQLDIKTRP